MRAYRPLLARPARPHPLRAAMAGGAAVAAAAPEASAADDLRLFATFWLGGLVFFGTYLA